jgi:glycosyltransferase involved in cell wall biosynthesis
MSTLRGGPTFAIADMTRGLTQAGVEVHIATTDDHGAHRATLPLGQPVQQDGITYWYFRRLTQFYMASWDLMRWLMRHVQVYDLVDAHYVFVHSSLAAGYAAQKHNVPYIVRPHGMLNRWGMYYRRPRLKRLSLHFLERHLLMHAAAVCLTGEQEYIEASELAIPFRPVIQPLGIEIPAAANWPARGTLRQQHPTLQGKTVLLFLSRFDAKKGLDLLLPAFAQLRQARPDVALVLAGQGTAAFTQRLQQQVAQLGIENDVIFAGFLSGADKLAALVDADIFVLPSYSENFGVVVVEALATGLPVVISDQVGLAREVASADAGVIIPCQPDALVRNLVSLVDQPEQRQYYAERGRALVEQRFSLETATDALLQLYTRLHTSRPHV